MFPRPTEKCHKTTGESSLKKGNCGIGLPNIWSRCGPLGNKLTGLLIQLQYNTFAMGLRFLVDCYNKSPTLLPSMLCK